MEKSKYYTPTIEEFHVGFQFDYFASDDSWETTTYNPLRSKEEEEDYIITLGVVTRMIQHEKAKEHIRVKYLDREDIESLDWVLDIDKYIESKYSDEGLLVFTHQYLPYIRLFVAIHEYSTDRSVTISSDTSILFTGNIKNKSRLKSIMDWTGTLVEKFEGTDEITSI